MRTHTPAGFTPATTEKKSTRRNGTNLPARATVTLELDRRQLAPGTERFLAAKAKEWDCTEGEACARLLDATAFQINYAEQIETIKDLKAHEKAQTGVEVTWEEFQRSERYACVVAGKGGRP